jgi:hypothetical protein
VESAKGEAGSQHSAELKSLRVEYETTIEQLRFVIDLFRDRSPFSDAHWRVEADVKSFSCICYCSDAHKSETDALRASHETMETSLKADHSKEVGTLTMDLTGERSPTFFSFRTPD